MIKRKKPQQDGAGRKTTPELAPMALVLAAVLLLVLEAGGCIGTPGAHKRMAKAAAASGALSGISPGAVTDVSSAVMAKMQRKEAIFARQAELLRQEVERMREIKESQGYFCAEEIRPGDAVYDRINGCSYRENPNIDLSQLRYLTLLHIGFDGKTHVGEMIVNEEIAEDVLEIFRKLYEAGYPIERMRLIDDYGADDNASMADNNSSAFNYRYIASSTKLSNHSWGRAIDINPLYNPYIYTAGGVLHVDPEGSKAYADRSGDSPYMIDHEDLCCRLFLEHGFTWGGNWKGRKDYQHFEKK